MKKYCLTIISFFTASAVFAILIGRFSSWDDLIEQSPEIVIARCTGTLGSTEQEKPVGIADGMISSDIKILSVLKGNTKPGPAHMSSQYWPYPGEEFLMFARYENDKFYQGYVAVEDYRIVPMGRSESGINYILTDVFPGKTLHQKIQLILNNRLNDLKDEIARDNEEEKRLEMNMSSNAPAPPRSKDPIHIFNGRSINN